MRPRNSKSCPTVHEAEAESIISQYIPLAKWQSQQIYLAIFPAPTSGLEQCGMVREVFGLTPQCVQYGHHYSPVADQGAPIVLLKIFS